MTIGRRGDVVEQATELLGSLAQRDVPLGALTTYRVGGNAALFVAVDDEDDLRRVANVVGSTGVEVLVIGRGSNMLVADSGYDGLVLTLGGLAESIDIGDTGVTVGAGVVLPVLARRSVAASLTGLEWAVGVPGSVGGGVTMNAGGHGSDIAACLVSADVFDLRTLKRADLSPAQLGLRFRGSDLANHQVVLAATFRLAHGDRHSSEAELAEIVRWRREHQPGGQNAGSVFVNPIPGELAAGELIDRLGLRGFRIGSAEVSTKHANFIQADEDGSANDVRAVMRHVHDTVLTELGVDLRSEIRLIGFGEATPPERGVVWP